MLVHETEFFINSCSIFSLSLSLSLSPGPTGKSTSVLGTSIYKFLSVLIHNYDHVTFYPCQYKLKTLTRRASLNASLGLDLQV